MSEVIDRMQKLLFSLFLQLQKSGLMCSLVIRENQLNLCPLIQNEVVM